MTDHPRFQIANGGIDASYRQYHGAALVALVFSAADWWLSRKSPERIPAPVSAHQPASNQPEPLLVETTP